MELGRIDYDVCTSCMKGEHSSKCRGMTTRQMCVCECQHFDAKLAVAERKANLEVEFQNNLEGLHAFIHGSRKAS